jgi:TolB-like protein
VVRKVLLAFSLFFIASCGYRLAGYNVFLPQHIRDIAVIPFVNETKRSEIEQRITESVMKEFIKRGKYKISSARETADAVLEGVISSFSANPVQFSPEGRAIRVEVSIAVKARLTDNSNKSVLWDQEHFVYREQFDIPETASDFFDQEIIAIDTIADSFARTLVTSILEGF